MKTSTAWRFVLALFLMLSLAGGLFVAEPVSAASNGYVISNGTSNSNRPAVTASPDGTKVCAVWDTFDTPPDDAFVRVYTIASNTWDPPLSSPALNVSESGGENSQAVRCAFDGAGRLHVLWSEGATKRIQHRFLDPGKSVTPIANWSGIIPVSDESDAQFSDLAARFSNPNGEIWTAYSRGGQGITVRQWTPSGWSGGNSISVDGHYPRIAVDDAGYVHVIWWERGAINYRHRDLAGNWSGTVTLPGADGAVQQTGLAVDRGSGDVHAVFSVGPDNGRVVRYVKKFGPSGTSFTGSRDLTGSGNYVVPRIAWGPGGRLVMVSDLQSGANSSLTFAVSNDNGASFSGASFLTDGGVSTQFPWITLDNAGRDYIAYWNNRDHAIYFTSTAGAGAPAPGPAPAPPPPAAADCGTYSCFASLGGILTASPAATGFNGRVYAFAKGSDNALYMASSGDGVNYTPYQNLGGILTAAPAAASANGRLYVFARGTDNALYVKSSGDGTNFNDWVSLGGILTAEPAAASANGRLFVFARGTDNALYVKSTGGPVSSAEVLDAAEIAETAGDEESPLLEASQEVNFGEWSSLGGILTAAPAAAGFRGRIYVFAKGTDDALYEKNSGDGTNFTEWISYGGILTAAPAAGGTNSALYVYANGSDSALYERHTTDGANYTEWASLGGQLKPGGSPAAAGVGGRIYAFVWWTNDELYTRYSPR